MMMSVTLNPEKPINPQVLVENTIPFDSSKNIWLRIALLTADNQPLPYFIIQIYVSKPEIKYILNYALYPDKNVYAVVTKGTLTSSDFILAGLNKSHAEGIKIYRMNNGKQFTDALFANQAVLDRMICSRIDDIMKSWMIEYDEKTF